MARHPKRPGMSRAISDPVRPEAPKPALPPADFSLLSTAEKDAIRLKAEARVLAREKERAEEAFLLAEEERLERELHPKKFEEMREITIDLALYADGITLDGRKYEYGRTYTVPKSTYDTLMEVQQRTYRHENEIQSGNPYNAFYNRQRYKNMEAERPYASLSVSESGSVQTQMHDGSAPRF